MLRRLHSLLLLALLIGGAGINYVQAAKLTGTCGAPGNEANVTWEYNEFGIKPVYIGWVIIRGTGPMMDFADYTQTPWYSKRARIVSVYVTQGVTTIGNNTFGGLYRVENVTIPHGVTSIGQNAFAGCSALTKVSIPHTVTSIGSEAFSSTNLTTLYVAWQNSIPAWVNLSDRTSQVTMHVPCGKTALYQAAAGWNNYNIADGPYYGTCSAGGNTNLPDWTLDCTGTLTIQADDAQMIDWYDLNAIPWYTIRGSIKQVVISGGVKSLGHHAFYDSQNITSVSLNPRLEKIGVLAFGFCRKLTSITIPNAVTSIGEKAFWYNESLTDVYVSWLGDAVPEMPSDIHNYEASRIRLHVPCSEPYIAKGWNTKFTLVVDQPLPSGTCGAQGNNLTWALDCNGTFTVSGSGDMADYSFYTAPWSLYMTSVQSVSISEGVTHIGNYAFYDSSIRSVNLPNSVTSIGNDAFAYCDKLTTVTIPSSVTSIGSLAFYGSDCPLTDIYVNWTTTATIPTWSNTTYTSNQSQVRLHVPCGTTAQYQAADGWQDYTIVEDMAHGTCGAQGDNLTWSLSCDGTLTISGTGEMYNWMSLADRPWHSLCTSIQRIVIEEGVTTTGFHAFYGAANLTSVSLPSTLQTLQFMTFFGCGKLTTLSIPSSVTYVGTRSLEGCSALTDVYMSETGDAVPTMPPGIHTYDASRIRLHIPCGQTAAYVAKGWNTKFTIEEGASGSCGTNVQWHFDPCTGVLSLSGTGAMTDYSYGEAPPWSVYRTSITSVSIANGITSIGSCAFNGCRWITSISIPNSVTSIGNSAFDKCSSLASISIPNSVTDIGHEAFYGCTSLASVSLSNNLTSIGTMAFYNCSSLTSITIPNSVTSIGYSAFEGCSSLASISIPNSVTYIGSDAFYGCTSLASVSLSNNLTSIGSMAFYKCSSLTSIIIPNGVTSIGLMAFQSCTHLTTVYIPSSVTSIGLYAFYGCNSLTDLYVSWTTTATIPNWNTMNAKTPRSSIRLHVPCGTTAQYQAKNIWKSCTIVEEAQGDCGADGENLRWALTCDGKRLTIYGTGAMRHFWTYETDIPWWSARGTIQELVIEEGVTTIGNHAFVTCSALTSVYLPNSLTAISYLAFGHCTSLPSLVIPSSVTSLAGMFIHNTPSLTDVYVSWTDDDVPTMPADIHPYDASQKRLHIPCGQEAAYTAKGWNTKFTYVTMSSGTCGTNVQWTLDHCTGVLTISGTGAMTDYQNESKVPWRSYLGGVTSVVVGNGVTHIGDYAFSECSNLTSITIPPSVTSIGSEVFLGCYTMESLYITDLTSWCNISFAEHASSPFYRNALTDVPHGGGNLYVNGVHVTTLTIPNGITAIPYRAFSGFAGITSFQFNQATVIGGFAFSSCHGLTDFTVPEGVTTIGNNAFAYCTNLQSISVPASVTSLGTNVLYNSLALTDIYVHWTENIPSWGSFTSKNPQSDISLHVPCGTAALYQAAEGWQDYTIVGDRAHGTCGAQGDNLTWSLSCDGILTIRGTGAMVHYWAYEDIPWWNYRGSIQRIVIEEGVTTIGNHAFVQCSNLTSVSLPNTLTAISYLAFGHCIGLPSLTIPSSVTSMAGMFIHNTPSLTDVYVSWTGDAVPDMPADIHPHDASQKRLHIPCGQADAYAAKGWNTKFTFEQENTHYTITVESDDQTMGTVDAIKIDN